MFFWMDSNTVSSLRTSPATNNRNPNQIKAKKITCTRKLARVRAHTQVKKETKHKTQVNLPEMFTEGTDILQLSVLELLQCL